MFRLSDLTVDDIGGGITLLDIGASGDVPDYWKPIAHLTNLIGFDPNEQECVRLNNMSSSYLSQKFLPYAIADENSTYTLYKTASIYCWSLLKPNLPWIRRFSFSDFFEIDDTEQISAVTLQDVKELDQIKSIDAIKLDTQGLELPILRAAEEILKECIWVETETGFTKNYQGETTFDEIASYMRSMGFGLFDINPNHRVSRKNSLSAKTGNEEILWCEAVWLRDYCQDNETLATDMTRGKALKALCIFANHGCYAFGLEAAKMFMEKGLLSSGEYRDLAGGTIPWALNVKSPASVDNSLLRLIINLIPRRYYHAIYKHLLELKDCNHPLSFLGNEKKIR